MYREIVAEFVGTTFLLMAIVGGGITVERLSPGDRGLQLFEAAIVTAFALIALILTMGPISGGHFNPAVTIADVALGGRRLKSAIGYMVAQVSGAILGTILANLMFELPAIELATTVRSGNGLALGEAIATLGLVLIIFVMVRNHAPISSIAVAVGVYIGAAYFFTSSASFANPAVAIARMFSDSFAGIAPRSVPGFVAMQLVGTGVAIWLVTVLIPTGKRDHPRAEVHTS